MKPTASIVAALAVLIVLAPAAKAACKVLKYRIGGADELTYELKLCNPGNEITMHRSGRLFFTGHYNEEGPFLEGIARMDGLCGPIAYQVWGDEDKGWSFPTGSKEFFLNGRLPVHDANCRATGHIGVRFKFTRH